MIGGGAIEKGINLDAVTGRCIVYCCLDVFVRLLRRSFPGAGGVVPVYIERSDTPESDAVKHTQ
jgi:hypothetical protein